MSNTLEFLNFWVTGDNEISHDIWTYCTIKHFPDCGNHLRASLVTLKQTEHTPVIRHELSTELVRVIDGQVLAYIDGNISKFATGTTIFLPPGTAHGFKAFNGLAVLFIVHTPKVSPKDDHNIVMESF